MLEVIVYFFKPLIQVLGGITLIVVIFSLFKKENPLLKKVFLSLSDEMKLQLQLICQKENVYIKDIMLEFFYDLKYRGKKYISSPEELEDLLKNYLEAKQRQKDDIRIDFDPELHIKLFYVKVELEKYLSLSFFRFLKKKKIYRKILKNLDKLLDRPHDKAYEILQQVKFYLRHNQGNKAYELLESLYKLAIKTFPENAKNNDEKSETADIDKQTKEPGEKEVKEEAKEEVKLSQKSLIDENKKDEEVKIEDIQKEKNVQDEKKEVEESEEKQQENVKEKGSVSKSGKKKGKKKKKSKKK